MVSEWSFEMSDRSQWTVNEWLEIGPTPSEESCQQVGTADYNAELALKECKTYKDQLQREYPNARLGIKKFPHDFGSYYEVVVYFDPKNEDETELAFDVENNASPYWDTVSREIIAGELA